MRVCVMAAYSETVLTRHALKLLRDARKRGKRKKVPMSLKPGDLVAMYHRQQGKCALSGAPLLCGSASVRQHGAMSLDRCIPSLGYELHNVQLLTRAVNNAKSTMCEGEFVAMCKNVGKWSDTKETCHK